MLVLSCFVVGVVSDLSEGMGKGSRRSWGTVAHYRGADRPTCFSADGPMKERLWEDEEVYMIK